MNWLTLDYIQKMAAKSDIDALKCSLEHWKQIRDAGLEEFFKAEKEGLVLGNSDFCACCLRFRESGECVNCPLGVTPKYCCNGLIEEWARSTYFNNSGKTTQQNTVNIVNYIERKYNELVRQTKKCPNSRTTT